MKTLIFLLSLSGSLGFFLWSSLPDKVSFQSLESVTEEGNPVFNEITFQSTATEDVWLMGQTHKGFELEAKQWDRLAIVVDKTKTPKVSKFYQLASGTKDFRVENAVPLKARCFACHSNGPRAVLMNIQSTITKPNWIERLAVTYWNAKIKSYGLVESREGIHFETGVAFQSKLAILKRPLNLKSCSGCHTSNRGIRNPLSLEQLGTAHFLVKNKLMPPFPFSISDKDRFVFDKLLGPN